MTPSTNTGPIVPEWVRDQIACHQEAWPRRVLAAGMIGTILVHLAMGAILWTADPVVVYALP
jgi:hypothetical protein